MFVILYKWVHGGYNVCAVSHFLYLYSLFKLDSNWYNVKYGSEKYVSLRALISPKTHSKSFLLVPL